MGRRKNESNETLVINAVDVKKQKTSKVEKPLQKENKTNTTVSSENDKQKEDKPVHFEKKIQEEHDKKSSEEPHTTPEQQPSKSSTDTTDQVDEPVPSTPLIDYSNQEKDQKQQASNQEVIQKRKTPEKKVNSSSSQIRRGTGNWIF